MSGVYLILTEVKHQFLLIVATSSSTSALTYLNSNFLVYCWQVFLGKITNSQIARGHYLLLVFRTFCFPECFY